MTQEVLAQEAGIVVRYLSAIEAGQENPTVNVLGRLAAALETAPRISMGRVGVTFQGVPRWSRREPS
jgi:transcriptional regulator with XRE-family HTH domain